MGAAIILDKASRSLVLATAAVVVAAGQAATGDGWRARMEALPPPPPCFCSSLTTTPAAEIMTVRASLNDPAVSGLILIRLPLITNNSFNNNNNND